MNVKEYLQYNFTEDEIKEMSNELAYKTKELEQLENAKKSLVAEFNSKIQSSKTTISNLANNISNGFDYREIECTVFYNEPQSGLKQIVRNDDGTIVRTENMTEDEMQEEMFAEVQEEALLNEEGGKNE